MESIRIDIINPKAKALLKDLADLNLIKIKKDDPKKNFQSLLTKLRKNQMEAPSLEEITAEVEKVREARYDK